MKPSLFILRNTFLAVIVIGSVMVSGCGPNSLGKGETGKTLVPLSVENFPVVRQLGAKTTTYQKEFCTLPPKEKTFKFKLSLIIDASGSNNAYGQEGQSGYDPGTDNFGKRRFGSLQRYIQNLEDEAEKFTFSMLLFSDARNFALASKTPGLVGNGYMDHVNPTQPTQSSFTKKADFLKIVDDVAEHTENDPLGHGYRKNDKAATEYDLALDGLIETLEKELELLEQQYIDNPTDFEKPFFAFMFVSDGMPQGQNVKIGDKTGPREIKYSEIESRLKQIDSLINTKYKEITLGYQFHTVGYSNSLQSLNGVNSSLCSQTQVSLDQIHKCPVHLLKKMAKDFGGESYFVFENEDIPYDKLSIPSYLQRSEFDLFFFSNTSLVWNERGMIERSPLNNGMTRKQLTDTCLGLGYTLDPITETCSFLHTDYLSIATQERLKTRNAVESAIQTCLGMVNPKGDLDGDGLNNCEEQALNSDERNPDTNGDSIPDGLALRLGLPFGRGAPNAATLDSDGDGVNNIREIIENTPLYFDNKKITDLKSQKITLIPTGKQDGMSCYSVNIQNVIYEKTSDILELVIFESPNVNTTGGIALRAKSILNCVGEFLGFYEPGDVCGISQ